ncbi:amino acid adenylation domain-containing protein [Paenibacillus polymyxa]|uniref:amino acid adenylation domain-containing protein n=1 Tax=Paenibacillus polymyxa TaxID=1406 RepID=UPI0025B6A63E|nr:amino acid adenylation domain-containing protein [Paenibacillus polymyxa]MDN4080988.1 amino acid adenylation domain-containing protein [Paenibacillus polymyxa]MDN4106616.1 amino acid adenylation domain-containing protein [Paenibacillus polymyxa]MDN4116636.1 amino acid adenylation domain-containing protein [Paenibacillus polymyxa]
MQNTIQSKLIDYLIMYKDKVAIEYLDQIISYGELDQRSDLIRNWLISRGAGNGDFIGLLIDDKVDLIVAIVGVLKARCAIVPFDSVYPVERLRTMVFSTNTTIVITDEQNANAFANVLTSQNQQVAAAQIGDIYRSAVQPPEASIEYQPNDRIYLYFTSGTTGLPKGIIGRNASLLHFIDWEIATLSIQPGTRISQFTSPCHDPFLRDIFVPLCSGGTICIPDNKVVLLDSKQLHAWIHDADVALIHCTPSLFKNIVVGVQNGEVFKNLSYILLAGEKVIPKLLEKWYETVGSRVQLINLYGPTETTLAKLYYMIEPSDVNRDAIPIGKAIKGARAILLDNDGRICTEGVAGEIYIRTPFRSLGYYNNEELTKQKFTVNPYNNDPADLLFRTGDLGRQLPDGNIEFLGRVDRQIKIRGYRIEPSEIESILMKTSGVEEVVVTARESSNGELFLCAYVVGGAEAQSLKEHLKMNVPDYMVPQHIMAIEKVPLNVNGKVDYKALPAPPKGEYVEPKGEMEKKLAQIWEEIFEVSPISSESSFFEMGGHSLNVMELVSKIYEHFEIQISIGDVFTNGTIKKLAACIANTNATQYVPITPAPHKPHYALSSAQYSQYITSAYGGGNIINNIPKIIKVSGPFNIERCTAAFNKLIDRHESLRTSFDVVNGDAVQMIMPAANLQISELNGADDIEELVESFIQPFDLKSPPLLRAGVQKISDEEHLLIFDMHHIISDGFSLSIFLKEFIALYDGMELPPLSIQYKDYSEWQKYHYFQSERFRTQENYWKNMFEEETKALQMPTDYPRVKEQISKGKQIQLVLSQETTNKIKERLTETSTTLYVFLLAAYNVFLFKYTGEQDITVGTAVAGRQHPDLRNVLGMFVNILALRNYPKGNNRFSDFLNEVKERTLEAFDYQEYPFERLLEVVPVQRHDGRHPLFDTMFILQNVEFPEFTTKDITFTSMDLHNHISKFDFRLESFYNYDHILFNFEYNTQMFKATTIEKWVEHFENIVEAVVNNLDIKLSDIQILSEQDQNASILDFNAIL